MFFRVLAIGLVFAAGHSYSHAQDDAADPKKKASEKKSEPPPIPKLKTTLKVVDERGEPVEGAVVKPSGMRTLANRGSHYFWNEKTHGSKDGVKTDENGMVEVSYPKYVFEKLELGEVTWLVEHPDYVQFREDIKVADKPGKVTLKYGYRIAATAVMAGSKELIKKDLFAAMSGEGGKWDMKKNGMLISRVFDRSTTRLRLIYAPKEGPLFFSKLRSVNAPKEKNRVLLRNIELVKGTRVAGKVDDAIPRPVENGYIVASINVGEEGDWQNTWSWSDRAEIKADGSFVFESLPPGEVVQLIAVCDGAVSDNPKKKDIEIYFPGDVSRIAQSSFVLPQLFEIGAKETPVIRMVKTTSCRIKVLDPDGKPLPGATISMWPNHATFLGGSTVLGSSYRSVDLLRDPGNFTEHYKRGSFQAVTDKDGTAVIANLPVKRSQSIAVGHKQYELPVGGRNRTLSVALKGADEIAEVTAKMQKKGTDIIE